MFVLGLFLPLSSLPLCERPVGNHTLHTCCTCAPRLHAEAWGAGWRAPAFLSLLALPIPLRSHPLQPCPAGHCRRKADWASGDHRELGSAPLREAPVRKGSTWDTGTCFKGTLSCFTSSTGFRGFFYHTSFVLNFIYLFLERERERECVPEGQREKETENPKRTPSSAWSLIAGLDL